MAQLLLNNRQTQIFDSSAQSFIITSGWALTLHFNDRIRLSIVNGKTTEGRAQLLFASWKTA